jgi:aminoglycoside phosphotransferase (APT) family kinase protein
MAVTDPAELAAIRVRLEQWLEAHTTGAVDVTVTGLAPPQGSGGYSNLAFLIDAEWGTGPDRARHELFARVEFDTNRLTPNASLEIEGRLITALAGTSIPVPPIAGIDTEGEVFGAPALIMSRVAGRVMPDNPPFTAAGWVLDLTPDEQALYYDHGLRSLASIATLDWRAAGLEFLPGPGKDHTTSVERIAFAETLLAHCAKGRSFPLLETALAQIREMRPDAPESLSLSWGDARLGNLMYAPDGPEIRAVLDWEQACIGSPELDLGWWLVSNRIHSQGCGLPLPPGFPDRDRTIARFEELTGHAVQHVDFYEAYAGLYIAAVMIGIADGLVAAGAVPPDANMRAAA